jgi:hypothetical protein
MMDTLEIPGMASFLCGEVTYVKLRQSYLSIPSDLINFEILFHHESLEPCPVWHSHQRLASGPPSERLQPYS